ncbi:imm11 family protein [Thioclava sp. F28-4]|uniref:imm11 family protein n=1 Tax=Thioclava sp. F28-4 TaxID=1915315 RepID=UPI0011BAACC7|nr:DUF1629 domain-containing protein [Thioclava sp. F28-4]
MTHIYSSGPNGIVIPTEAPEWKANYPYLGEAGKKTLEIVQAFREGRRKMLPEEIPKNLIADKPRKNWPDIFITTNGLLVVREPVREVLERLDPGIHQFFPFDLKTKRGVAINGPWFAMNVTAEQDSIVLERSRVHLSESDPERLNSFFVEPQDGDVVVDPARQSGLNLWREKRFNMSLLGSDAFQTELEAKGIKFFPSFRAQSLGASATRA